MDETKRDPELFLAKLKDEESSKSFGRLKIFFGAAAGVGKTYAMLEAAKRLKVSGKDVVVGYVETHKRSDTEALLQGLEVMPRRVINYKGKELFEFDLDSALERHPEIILVDELAHTNIPGSRHTKRFQDVEELLANGIDVYTTLNVQHIESLNDVIAQITGVEVKERLPDYLFEKAFEIELVDLPPDELIERLKEGKVYIPDKASDALKNFFRKGNLIALREIALRYSAQKVDAQMHNYRHINRIGTTWPACEKLLVCIGPSPLSAVLIRRCKRMAEALKVRWIGAYIETAHHFSMSSKDRLRLQENLALAEQLGAEVIEATSNRVSEEIVRLARLHNVTKIIIGKPQRSRWKEIIQGSIVDELIKCSGEIDVYVITSEFDETDSRSGTKGEKGSSPYSTSDSFGINLLGTASLGKYSNRIFQSRSEQSVAIIRTLLLIATCTIFARLLSHLELANIVMLYMLCIVVVSIAYGRQASVLASVLSVAAFDFFCVKPYYTFAVADTQYLITFLVMLITALVISSLTGQIKLQAEMAHIREARTQAQYSLSRELANSGDINDLIAVGLRNLNKVFNGKAALLLADQEGRLEEFYDLSNTFNRLNVDKGVAGWAFKNKQTAGFSTQTLPASEALYVPLLGVKETIGVLALAPYQKEHFLMPEQTHLLENFANQIAIALERALLARETEAAQLQVKTEQLRNSLLSSVSHDIRTPLATIAGAASSLVEANENSLDVKTCKEMASEIYGQSVRLNNLVTNLLDMTKIQSGGLKPNCSWQAMDDIIGATLNIMESRLQTRKVSINLPDKIPMLRVDPVLIQQVLINLLDNALKYTPEGSPLQIEVIAVCSKEDHKHGCEDGRSLGKSMDFAPELEDGVQEILISIKDEGPGISEDRVELIFDKFVRGENPHADGGSGLGLSICKAIVEAHGGKIWMENLSPRGSKFCFSLKNDNR